MSEQPAPAQRTAPERIQRGFEYVLFNSRWLMAPFYVGLVVAIAVLFLNSCACSGSSSCMRPATNRRK